MVNLCQTTGIKLVHDILKNILGKKTEFCIKIANLILLFNFVFFKSDFYVRRPKIESLL